MKKEWKELNLVDYLSGNLSEQEVAEVEDAIANDPLLRNEITLMRREIRMMRTAAEDPYEESRLSAVHSGVMREVRSGSHQPAMFNSAWRSYMRAVGVMLLMAVVLSLFFILRPEEADEAVNTPVTPPVREEPVATAAEAEAGKPVKIQLTTSNPKIKIFWTVDPTLEGMD